MARVTGVGSRHRGLRGGFTPCSNVPKFSAHLSRGRPTRVLRFFGQTTKGTPSECLEGVHIFKSSVSPPHPCETRRTKSVPVKSVPVASSLHVMPHFFLSYRMRVSSTAIERGGVSGWLSGSINFGQRRLQAPSLLLCLVMLL